MSTLAPGTSDRVLFVYNPRSGRGRAQAALAPLGEELARAGLGLAEHHLQAGPPDSRTISGFRAVIAAGGDGTVAALCAQAGEAGVPLLHYPTGTENLFAREFGMPRSPRAAAEWIVAGRTREVDLASYRVNGGERLPIAIMLSVGPDAGVIHRLNRVRSGTITHASYVPHVLKELWSPTLPVVRIEVDGRPVSEGRRGMVVVANLRSYGGGFNPACDAVPDDGLLDVAFHPASGGARWLGNMAMCLAGAGRRVPGGVLARGARVSVETEGGALQTDGEAGWSGETRARVEIEARGRVLTILAPPNAT